MNTNHPATLDPDDLLKDCQVRRLRRSGPGGQHRNKVETAVALKHRPTDIEAEANERRSQAENQRMALKRLRINLALCVRSEVEQESIPSHLWEKRCRNRRISVNKDHLDFPALLAEALDVIVHFTMDIKVAADALRCSPSQLTKLLKTEPRALAIVNERRAQLGMHRLK